MKKTIKKLTASITAILLCVSLCSLSGIAAFAEEMTDQSAEEQIVQQTEETVSDTAEVQEDTQAGETDTESEAAVEEEPQTGEAGEADQDSEAVVVAAGEEEISHGEIGVNASTDNEKSFVAYVKEVNVPGGAKEVLFAVWSDAKGQDDIKWYKDTAANDQGTYAVSVQIKNHKSPGLYNVHVYARLKDGTLKYFGKTTFNVSKPSATLKINNVSGQLGRFGMIGNPVTAVSGVTKVQFAVWRDANQSDIKWYNGVKRSATGYSVFAQVENHKRHWGTYNVHMYVTMGNGLKVYAGATKVKINPDNYIYFSKLNSDNSRYAITILNANVSGKAGSTVYFPVWSNTGGQDDIRWYKASNIGANHFRAFVDGVNHKHSGLYNVHTYVDSKCVRKDTFNMSLDRGRSRMLTRANNMSSTTGWLVLVDKNTHHVAIFTGRRGNWKMIKYWSCGDGRAVTPTPVGVFRVGTKGYYFDSGPEFRCFYFTQITGSYYFHSVLCHHNGVPFGGRQLGAGVSHGCVRLQKENALWLQTNVPTGSTIYIFT